MSMTIEKSTKHSGSRQKWNVCPMLSRYQRIVMAVMEAMSNGKAMNWKPASRNASGVSCQVVRSGLLMPGQEDVVEVEGQQVDAKREGYIVFQKHALRSRKRWVGRHKRDVDSDSS
jgi:hypothetical protein